MLQVRKLFITGEEYQSRTVQQPFTLSAETYSRENMTKDSNYINNRECAMGFLPRSS
jgi:hypothetical protein